MTRKRVGSFLISFCLITAFVIWTVLICFVDVGAIGPNGSEVGFSTLNRYVHDALGVNMELYVITDWLGLVPVFTAMGFGILGLVQWISRKSILKVDGSIIALGVFYIAVIGVYLFFEGVVINYRPVLIDGYLEGSYPSSTTTLVMCVMPTAVMQLNSRIKNIVARKWVAAVIVLFIMFMLIGRLLSGVHWLSDIIGGILLSSGLVLMYYSVGRFEISD